MADIVIEYASRGAEKTITELKRLEVAMNSTADGTVALARTLNTSIKNAQEFSKSIGLTTQQTARAAQRLKELNSVNANAGQSYRVLNKELGISRQQFLEISSAVKLQEQTLQDLERQQRIATEGFQTLAAASAGVAAAIGGAFAQGTGQFLEFSEAVKQVGAISGQTGTESLQELSDEIERLGIVTSKAPAEIARTSVSLARAGFTADQTRDALEGVVRASEATGESLEVTGDIIAKTLRTFRLPAEESLAVADALTATANSTNTTVSSIGESLAFVGAQAASANQPLEDTLIAIGLLGDAGIQGSSAGTQLGQALERLKIASAGAGSELDNLVRGQTKAVDAFKLLNIDARDSEGQLRSLIDILPEIRNGLSSLSQQEQDIVFSSLFGVQGGRALNSLLQATPQRIAEVTVAIRESQQAAADTSEELLEGLGGAFELLGGSLGSLSIQFGEFGATFLEPIVRTATSLINTFLELPGPIQKVIIANVALTGVLSAAIAVLSTLQILKARERANLVIDTALQLKNNVARQAGTVATLAQAAATGTLTAAQTALIKSTLRTAGAIALIAGAVGATVLAFQRFGDGGKEAEEAAANLSEEILKLREVTQGVEEDLAIEVPPAATDPIDALVRQINRIPLIPDITTNSEKRVNDLTIAVGEFSGVTGEVLDRALELQQVFPDAAQASEEDFVQAIQTQKELAASLTSNRDLLASLDREQLGSEAYQSLSQQLQNNITQIERSQQAIREQTGVAQDGTIATEAQATATNELAQAAANLENILGGVDQRNAEFSRTLAEGTAELNEQLAQQLISQEDFAKESQALEQQSLRDRLNSNRQAADELQKLIAEGVFSGDDLANAQQELIALETETFGLRTDIAKSTTDARIAEEERAAEELAKAVEETQAAIALAESGRLADIQQRVNDGVISQREADAERLDSTRDRLDAELAASRANIQRLQALAAEGNVDAESDLRDEIQRTADLQLQVLENEQAKQQAVADAAIADIRRRSAAQQRASEEQIRNIELEAAAQQRQENAIARQNELLQAQGNLQQALANLSQARTNLEIQSLNEGLQLSQRLATEEDARTARVIRNRLRELGVRGDAEDIQVAIADLEEKAAERSLNALLEQQRIERESLELQNQSNELAARRAITEARIAEIRAQANIAQAEADLAAAQQISDPEERDAAVTAAQAQLESSRQVADLSGEATTEAEKQLENVRAIGDAQEDALSAQQEAARLTAEAAVSAAEFAEALTRAERASGALSNNLSNAGIENRRSGGPMNAGQPYLVGDGPGGRIGPNTEIVVPGTKSSVVASRKAKQILGGTYTPPSGMVASMGRSPTKADPLLKEVQKLNKNISKIEPGVRIDNAKFPTQVTVAKPDDAQAVLTKDLQRLRRIALSDRRFNYGN